MTSLASLIASEASLVEEAALAVPHSFDKCTHPLGPIRQAVYLCLTCSIPRGLCSACSVACHGDHEQIELFPKRAFVCDCPTLVGGVHCTLHHGPVAGNAGNVYGQNFHAKFCRCHRSYDAKKEKETMLQCLLCEDWFHESCLNLRTRPDERPPSPELVNQEPNEAVEVDSNASSDLPPPLIPSSTYNSFVCGSCVLSNSTLKRWAGTKGAMMVVRHGKDEDIPVVEKGCVDPRWKILNGEDEVVEIEVFAGDQENKRSRETGYSEDEGSTSKKRRIEGRDAIIVSSSTTTSSSKCLAPPINLKAQTVIESLQNMSATRTGNHTYEFVGDGDVFLTEGWRERWCRCSKCLSSLQQHPCLLDEEETYEPPEDPDSGMSLEDLGMRALMNLPRDRAIDGIRAYNMMRDELISYLRPFAQEGRVVREEDVREFFESKAEETKL